MSGRTTVLSVVGAGRSGTTILASVLGELPAVFAAGEIRWLWQRGVLENRSCGCSLPPLQCPVWSAVVERVLGTAADHDLAHLPALTEILRSQREVTALRSRRRVIRSATDGEGAWPALDVMREVTAQVCQALVEATDATVIVDTSKRAQEAAVFAALDSIDHYVLHIVRDPRAVAYSWRRSKSAGPGTNHRTMGTRGLLASVQRWTENSLGAELLRRRLPADRWLSVRYEDFAADPRSVVTRVAAHLGLTAASPFDAAGRITLGTNHIVAGNPSRFRTGSVQIRADTEWRREMTQRDKLSIALLTLPLLLRYRYPVRAGTVQSHRRSSPTDGGYSPA